MCFDAKTGEKIKEIGEQKEDLHKGSIYSFAWSPDSKKILTASADKTAKVWNVESGACETTFNFAEKPAVGDMQMSAVWHGDYMVTTSLSGAINFLDPADPSKPAREELPQVLRQMTPDERVVYVEDLRMKREQIRQRILELGAKRRQHISEQAESRTFDGVVRRAIREQVERRGLSSERP